jgi:hypothetical protein
MEYGVLTFLIAAIAIVAFWFAGKVEERFSTKSVKPSS